MKRNKKGGEYLITRARYKSIKAFDHQQMEQFCTDIYKSGFRDGRDSVPGVDVNAVMEAVESVKGIGPKRLADIKAGIQAVFEDKEGQESRGVND